MTDEKKPSMAERMVAAGEAMDQAGKSTQKAGCSITAFVFAAAVLAVIVMLIWAVGC